MDEGLTEDAGTGVVELALAVGHVVVECEPAVNCSLVDIGLEQVFVAVVVFEHTLVLLNVEGGAMREVVRTTGYGNAVTM